MLDLGCTEALNLDGGGSSTMVVDDTVINTPCSKVQENGKLVEAVSDADFNFAGLKFLTFFCKASLVEEGPLRLF